MLPHHCHLPFTEAAQEFVASMSSLQVQEIQQNPFLFVHALCRQFPIHGKCYTIAGLVIILVAKERKNKYFKIRITAVRC